MSNPIFFVYSKPGEISPRGCWLAIHEHWMYIADTLVAVAKLCFDEWQQDKHLVG